LGSICYGPLPPVDRLAPQTALRDRDAELNLLLRVGARVSRQRRCRRSEQQENRQVRIGI
jgi:hypothetical protein